MQECSTHRWVAGIYGGHICFDCGRVNGERRIVDVRELEDTRRARLGIREERARTVTLDEQKQLDELVDSRKGREIVSSVLSLLDVGHWNTGSATYDRLQHKISAYRTIPSA